MFYYETRDYNALCAASDFFWLRRRPITSRSSPSRRIITTARGLRPIDNGHWKKRLMIAYEDELRLAELKRVFERYQNFCVGFDFGAEAEPVGGENIASFTILRNFTTEKGFTAIAGDCAYQPENPAFWIRRAMRPS